MDKDYSGENDKCYRENVREWQKKYPRKFVAIYQGKLLEVADTIKDLSEAISKRNILISDCLIARVPDIYPEILTARAVAQTPPL